MSSYWGQIPSKVVRGNRSNVYNGKVTPAKMHELTDPATGKPYEIPDDDYRQYLGERPGAVNTLNSLDKLKVPKSIEKYISEAFESTVDIKTVEPRATGGDTGHIIKLEYAVMYKILRVTFKKSSKGGQVVAYLNVPAPVAGELLYLAESNQTQISATSGTLRHVLGMRFWDLIRIRGTIHGTRYPFNYVTDMGNGRDSYAKGTATPDWGKTKFVLVNEPGSSRLSAKPVDQLTDIERKQMEDRSVIIQQDIQSGDIPSVDMMFRRLDKANIEPGAKEHIRKQMESMKTGRDAERTLYNYLGTMGLL